MLEWPGVIIGGGGLVVGPQLLHCDSDRRLHSLVAARPKRTCATYLARFHWETERPAVFVLHDAVHYFLHRLQQ